MSDDIKNVRLSFCCKENWNEFASLDERTRFCAQCQHRVVDFTNANKSDLEKAFQSGERVCGRFKSSQMDPSFMKYAAASILALTLASACTEEVSPSVLQPEMTEEVLMGDVAEIGDTLEIYTTGIVVPDSLDFSTEGQ